jgi:hypothetical protein
VTELAALLCRGHAGDLGRHRVEHAGGGQEAVAAFIRPGALFLDLNSASPGTKQQAAALMDAAGGALRGSRRDDLGAALRHPRAHAAGRAACSGAELADVLQAWGMDARVASEKLGVASPPRCAAA